MARIVIADDERDILDLVAFTLRFAGHEVITTINGEEAVQATIRENPDLVLLDVRMPRMTGYEACQLIKTDPVTRHIPVVFLSAKGQESEIQTGMDLGASDYILKPFSPDQLSDRIMEVLNQDQ